MRVSGILTFDGREYVVNTPPFVEQTYPLALCLHGGDGSGPGFRLQMSVGATVGEDTILVFPTATINQDGFTAWNSGGPFNPLVDDIAYLNDLLYAMISTGRVNTDRMYLFGHSNGAMMCYRIICENDVYTFRGSYTMAGDLLVDNPDTFTGKLRETHGVLDENVPIDGGFGEDSFYHIDYPDLYVVVPSFTKVITPGIGNLNALDDTGHSMASIKTGLIAQGTPLPDQVREFIYN